MIEYHSNTDLIAIIKNESKFNPNGLLRGKTLLFHAVNNNNFPVFSAIVNHNKFNNNLDIKPDFISKILKRVSYCDIDENRRFLEELYKINYIFKMENLHFVTSEGLFSELFNKIEKNLTEITTMTHNIKNFNIFKIIYYYLKNNFPNTITKQFIDSNYFGNLLNGYYNSEITFGMLQLFIEENIDIKTCNNSNSIAILMKARNYNIFQFFKNNLIKYNCNLIDDLNLSLAIANYSEYHVINQLQFIMENYDDLKIMYLSINNDTQKPILNMILNKNIIVYHAYSEEFINKIVDFLIIKKIINVNPFEKMVHQIIQSEMNSCYPQHLETFKKYLTNIFLRLMYFGFKPTQGINKLLETLLGDKMVNIDDLIKEIKPMSFEKVIKKKTKKNLIV